MMEVFDFKQLQVYIDDLNITDINYNGRQLWIDDLNHGRYLLEDIISDLEIETMCYQLANHVNLPFNTLHPVIEAETSDLRISLIHHSVARSGHSLSIRKTPAIMRLSREKLVKEGYASGDVLDLLAFMVYHKFNFIISGLPGAGKTELVKYLTSFIPPDKRVITIEDTLELRYFDIHTCKDSVMLKVNETFTYEDAIKASLRQRPDWLLVSEVRSKEVVYLLQAISTGASVISTIHAEGAQLIPQRLLHMFPNLQLNNEVLKQNIYESIDIGIHIEASITTEGIKRYIREIIYYYYDENPKAIEIYQRDKGLIYQDVFSSRLDQCC